MLIDHAGRRKYLVPAEWRAFLQAARRAEARTRTFCFVLSFTGARVSEVLALTPASVDFANSALIIKCLKRREQGIYRSVPVPKGLIALLEQTHQVSLAKSNIEASGERLWPWCRGTGWGRVKQIAEIAGLPEWLRCPRMLRHSFGVEGTTYAGVPVGIIKRWLGHVRLESTLIYCEAVGEQERIHSNRMFADSLVAGIFAPP